MLNVAYTLGASRWKVFYKVFLPATFPEVVDALRITIGWAWTYLIVAELLGAERGIGTFILISERFLRMDRIIAAILTIGVLGLITTRSSVSSIAGDSPMSKRSTHERDSLCRRCHALPNEAGRGAGATADLADGA